MIGRPSSLSDPGNAVPMPRHQKFLNSMVTLSRIMSRCMNQIYSPRHESVLRMWTTANDIRQDLHRFAEQQSRDMGFQLVGHVKPGEEGFCQALLSSSKLFGFGCAIGIYSLTGWMYSLSSDSSAHLPAVPHLTHQTKTKWNIRGESKPQ